MEALEWIRFIVGAALIGVGVAVFIIQMIGVFKFNYVLLRMHAASMGDTLGIGFTMLGLIVYKGLSFTSVKMILIIFFLWFSSPAAAHLIAKLEHATRDESEIIEQFVYGEGVEAPQAGAAVEGQGE